jgi:co-chaperonin GroES (HSP10)
MNIVPTGNRLLCKPIDVDPHYPGSPILLLPDRLDLETEQQAEIIAVGPGIHDEDGDFVPTDPDLKPGTWILHEVHRRVAFKDKMFWLTTDDVVGILSVSE